MRSFAITAREAGGRLDKYLFRVLTEAPAGFVYKMLRKKNIVLNEKKASGKEILAEGDEVRLYLAEETFLAFAPAFVSNGRGEGAGCGDGCGTSSFVSEAGGADPLDIVYEDADILVINKPAGLLSQRAKPGDDSANDRVIAYLLASGQLAREDLRTFHPSVCNRLDRNTSGLLIAGKTLRGLQETAALLKDRSLKKYYHALVAGRVADAQSLAGYLVKDERANRVWISPASDRGDISDPGGESDAGATPHSEDGSDAGAAMDSGGESGLAAREGAWVETAYRPFQYIGDATLLEVELITGKSHQIRAHLSSIGHPILGDEKYGDAARNHALAAATGIRSQLLCACRMEFPDGRVIGIPDPEAFRTAEAWLARRSANPKETPLSGEDRE